MKATSIKALFQDTDRYADEEIVVQGWIRTLRDQKQFAFINLNDGTCLQSLQVVAERSVLADFDDVVRYGNGSAVTVRGTLVLTPNAKQPFELKAIEVILEGDCPPDYPLQPKRHTPEFMRRIAHLRPRANLYSAVFRVRSQISWAIHRFFHERDFVYVHTPIITSSDAEGAGEMFTVTTLDPRNVPLDEGGATNYSDDFFGKHTSLTVSGQLPAEAYALAFSKVYTFGPTFRAEQSNTPKHAAEFWMIEPEIAFAGLKENMELAEDMIRFILSDLLENCSVEMDFFNRFVDRGLLKRLDQVLAKPFAVMTYTDAIDVLLKVKDRFEYPVFWGCDLQTEHERYLTEEHLECPVFVTNYPKDIKAFYMKLNDDGKTVAAMDLLVPGVGEIIGGSQREEDYDKLQARIVEMGLEPDEYDWYLQLRKFGTVKHAGYGLGLERLIMYVTGVANIRDVIPFPRTPGHAEF